jgi:zinc transporter ZupT
MAAQRILENRDEHFHIGQVQGASAVQMLMIVGIMTAHSFAEGIGVGVAYGDGQTFGAFISIAIAIHNIPEGLAISLILIPRGTSVLKSALWSIFSSVPQPLMAVPAFLFVLAFRPFLPVGLGLAAGAMFWMVFRELLPEALEDMPKRVVYPVTGVAVMGMLLFQLLIG